MRISLGLYQLAVLLGLLAASTARSGPMTIEEAARQREALARLDSALAAETTQAGKFTQYLKAMREDPDVDVRGHVLDLAVKQSTGPELEALLLKRLDEEPDGGLRSRCAAMLGHCGSEKCLTRLVQAAATDQETTWMVADIRGRRSARRDAVFALAELGRRLPRPRVRPSRPCANSAPPMRLPANRWKTPASKHSINLQPTIRCWFPSAPACGATTKSSACRESWRLAS